MVIYLIPRMGTEGAMNQTRFFKLIILIYSFFFFFFFLLLEDVFLFQMTI